MHINVQLNIKKKNNPKLEKYRENIKNNEKPDYSFETLLEDFYNYFKKEERPIINKKTNKVVMVEYDKKPKGVTMNDCKRYYLKVLSGQTGMEYYNIDINNIRNVEHHDESESALYYHNVFFYNDNEDNLFAIFHHYGYARCKTSLLSAINELLRPKGYYFKMDLACCNEIDSNILDNTDFKDVTLIRKYVEEPTDIADADPKKLKKNKKEIVDNKLCLCLDSPNNHKIIPIIKNFILKRKKADKTIVDIADLLNIENPENIMDAKLLISIKGNKKVIDLNKFDGMIGEYYITKLLRYDENTGYPKFDSIREQSDKYAEIVMENLKEEND